MSGFGGESAAHERSYSPQPGRDRVSARSNPTSTSSFSGFGDDVKGDTFSLTPPLTFGIFSGQSHPTSEDHRLVKPGLSLAAHNTLSSCSNRMEGLAEAFSKQLPNGPAFRIASP